MWLSERHSRLKHHCLARRKREGQQLHLISPLWIGLDAVLWWWLWRKGMFTRLFQIIAIIINAATARKEATGEGGWWIPKSKYV